MINANPMPRYAETAQTNQNILDSLMLEHTESLTQHELSHSSNMPLDTEGHWRWSNPLNLIVLGMVALFVLAIVGSIVSII